MNDPLPLPPPEPQRHVGHETTDVSPFSIGLFALGLVLMIALLLPLLAWMFWRLEAHAQRADPPPNPLASDQPPPAPRLQVDPAADLARLRRAEQHTLSSYGWIDQEQRVVRIPVDRAIEILAQRGLPEPKGPSHAVNPKESTP